MDTWRYYDDRPELARYTIERELARNTFVVTEDGVEVTDAAARLGALEGGDAYLLRLANQSLFGDCLVALGSALDASGAQAAVSSGISCLGVPLRKGACGTCMRHVHATRAWDTCMRRAHWAPLVGMVGG